MQVEGRNLVITNGIPLVHEFYLDAGQNDEIWQSWHVRGPPVPLGAKWQPVTGRAPPYRAAAPHVAVHVTYPWHCLQEHSPPSNSCRLHQRVVITLPWIHGPTVILTRHPNRLWNRQTCIHRLGNRLGRASISRWCNVGADGGRAPPLGRPPNPRRPPPPGSAYKYPLGPLVL